MMKVALGLAFFTALINARKLPMRTDVALRNAPFQKQEFSLPDPPAILTGQQIAGFSLVAKYLPGSQGEATFAFQYAHNTTSVVRLHGLYNPNGWFTVAPDGRDFTLTWSDGGAIGGFHTRAFHVSSRNKLREEATALSNIRHNFEARHSCKTRGDNFLAVKWLSPNTLLMEASVYSTGDCGTDLGYTERYSVRVSTGEITRRVIVPRK